MSSVVLDASALLAVLQDEPGADVVVQRLPTAVMSAVNYAEVLTSLCRHGRLTDRQLLDLHNILSDVRPFDDVQALTAARLEPETRSAGLSLGDRACLALALSLEAAVLTADRVWTTLDVGVAIQSIRS